VGNSEIESADILIVGGGPSGLVSALLLAQLNLRTIVVERNAFTDEHPKAHELNARSIEILRDVGITEEDLAVEASPMEDAARIQFCRSVNEELGRIDLLADPARREKYEQHLQQTLPYLNLSQSEFEKILVARAEESPLIKLLFGHQWNSFEERDGNLISTISGGAGDYCFSSKYLLGCDGASSRVRKALGIEMDGPSEIQSFVNAYFKFNLREHIKTPAKLYWILHPEYAGSLVAHHIEKRWVYAVPVFKPWERPEDFTADVMRDRIQGALGFESPDLQITSLSTWQMTAQIAQSYRRGPVFLVGDAAHRFPPTGGLGMNTGIADAHNLCWKLGLVLSGQAGDGLLDTYERERKPVAAHNCQESLENFDKIFEVIDALGLSKNGMAQLARLMNSLPIRLLPESLRRAVLHTVTRIPFWMVGRALRKGRVRDRVTKAIANQVNHFDRLGLDIGYVYDEGALIADHSEKPMPEDLVSHYIPSTHPGARLPHCWINVNGERRSTLDNLSYTQFSLYLAKNRIDHTEGLEIPGVQIVDTSEFQHELFPPDQVLLVRPDGHIAWRSNANVCNAKNLQSTVDTLLAAQPQ
jgi:2,4-dichlorophenol 6-monooxygenase